jgi:hypothetical protein
VGFYDHQNFTASSDFILSSNCGNRRCLRWVNAARLFPSVAGKFKVMTESENLFSPALQQKFRAEARAGILKFNFATAGVEASPPFGRRKTSGLGPSEHGEADRLFYTRMRAVYDADNLQ